MKTITLLFAALAAASAQAHVGLEYQLAAGGASYKATFQVGHGCEKSPTRQLSVQVPAAMSGARPMPKPGWALEVTTEADKVSRITWTARTRDDALPDNLYDEFVIVARTPDQPGTLVWPVVQTCEQGRHEWLPKLDILPGATDAGHKH